MNETIKKDKEYKLNLLKKIKEENEKYFILILIINKRHEKYKEIRERELM